MDRLWPTPHECSQRPASAFDTGFGASVCGALVQGLQFENGRPHATYPNAARRCADKVELVSQLVFGASSNYSPCLPFNKFIMVKPCRRDVTVADLLVSVSQNNNPSVLLIPLLSAGMLQ